jgi:hypothetical protein
MCLGLVTYFLVIDQASISMFFNNTMQRWETNTTDFSTAYNSLSFRDTLLSTNGENLKGTVQLDSNIMMLDALVELGSQQVPSLTLPNPISIEASVDTSSSSKLAVSDSWILTPSLHISHAYSIRTEKSSAIQIALPFMVIVVICNAVKVFAIFCTLRALGAGDIILTQGDAIASFLQRPDMMTVGSCMLDAKQISKRFHENQHQPPQTWIANRNIRHNTLSVSLWATKSYILIAGGVAFVAIVYAVCSAMPNTSEQSDSTGMDWRWASASDKLLSISLRTFDTKGLLFNAWLANLPQLLISAFYMFWNRLWTRSCFDLE